MSFPMAKGEAMVGRAVRPPQAAVSKTGDKFKILMKTLDFLRSTEYRLPGQIREIQ
jgi:hypothetical protein